MIRQQAKIDDTRAFPVFRHYLPQIIIGLLALLALYLMETRDHFSTTKFVLFIMLGVLSITDHFYRNIKKDGVKKRVIMVLSILCLAGMGYALMNGDIGTGLPFLALALFLSLSDRLITGKS